MEQVFTGLLVKQAECAVPLPRRSRQASFGVGKALILTVPWQKGPWRQASARGAGDRFCTEDLWAELRVATCSVPNRAAPSPLLVRCGV